MARGDHIRVYTGAICHHGIDLGNGRGIHFRGDDKRNAWVRETSLEDFAKGGAVKSVHREDHYDLPPEEVVRRAKSLLGSKGLESILTPDFDLALNNCEILAIYCKTGMRSPSPQIKDFLDEIEGIRRVTAELLPVPIVADVVGTVAGAVTATTTRAVARVKHKVFEGIGDKKRQRAAQREFEDYQYAIGRIAGAFRDRD